MSCSAELSMEKSLYLGQVSGLKSVQLSEQLNT